MRTHTAPEGARSFLEGLQSLLRARTCDAPDVIIQAHHAALDGCANVLHGVGLCRAWQPFFSYFCPDFCPFSANFSHTGMRPVRGFLLLSLHYLVSPTRNHVLICLAPFFWQRFIYSSVYVSACHLPQPTQVSSALTPSLGSGSCMGVGLGAWMGFSWCCRGDMVVTDPVGRAMLVTFQVTFETCCTLEATQQSLNHT